jgi:hypothetical protein
MSSVFGSAYRCPGCGHQEINPHGYPMCPQCASDWRSVSKPQVSSDVAVASTFANISRPVESGCLSDALKHRVPANVEADSIQKSASVVNGGVASSTHLSGPGQPPFAVSVKQDQQHGAASRICLEIEIQNTTAQLLHGQIWLTDRDGHEGPPESFTLPASTQASSASGHPLTVFPQIDRQVSGSSHIAVRIKPKSSRVAFWQGDLLLRRQTNGSISVTIDKSVQAETSLGGIDNGVVNIYADQRHDGGWQSMPLRLRGPKDLAHPDDVHRPAFSGLNRHIALRDGFPAAPPREVARLTLSQRLSCGRESYVQLLAGRTFHLGRARSWDSRDHKDFLPNDIVLRSVVAEEPDDYISRYHGRIRIMPGDVHYENLSGNGTHVGNGMHGGGRTLSEKGALLSLCSNTTIQPGRSVASTPNKSLGLHVRCTSSNIDMEAYELLAQNWHLQSSVDPANVGDTVTLNRTDAVGELEHYVVFPQATLIGSSEALCGWHLPDISVQSVHAILLWFDGSFWIEPSHNCEVRVNDVLLPKNRLRRLAPSASVKIGNLQFLVLPEWKQHIIDCRCCTGHGMAVQPAK